MDLNLKQILEGYINYAKLKFGTLSEEHLTEIEKRTKICTPCKNNVNNTCNLCSCPIKVKVCGPSSTCPDSPPRW